MACLLTYRLHSIVIGLDIYSTPIATVVFINTTLAYYLYTKSVFLPCCKVLTQKGGVYTWERTNMLFRQMEDGA